MHAVSDNVTYKRENRSFSQSDKIEVVVIRGPQSCQCFI